MDLREKKTLRAIRTAFLQLRGQRPLEKITVKELCELAEISKATFYITTGIYMTCQSGCRRRRWQPFTTASATRIGPSAPRRILPESFLPPFSPKSL